MSSTLCFWTAQFLIFGLHKLRLEVRKLVGLHAWKTTLAEGQVSHMGEYWCKDACRLMEK